MEISDDLSCEKNRRKERECATIDLPRPAGAGSGDGSADTRRKEIDIL